MAGARILVVEDERIVAEDIQDILRSLGHSVCGVASSGEEAVEKAGETRPDLVLMDIMLDGTMDGVEAAEQISAPLDIPVVYLTAYADDSTLERAKLTSPYGYVLKPFEERDVHSAIEMALHKHAADRTLRARARLYSATLNSIGHVVVAADTSGNVTFVNSAAEVLTGWRLEDARGKPLKDVLRIVHGETGNAAERIVARVLRGGGIAAIGEGYLFVTEDGARLPVDGTGEPMRDEKGETGGVVLVFHSAAEREPQAAGTASHFASQEEASAGRAPYDAARSQDPLAGIITKNARIRRILKDLPKIAASDSTILLEGPSGSGKELFARAIHNLSGRKDGRYVVVSCGALPDTLLESELFGYVKGAFTDAKKDKPGRFALAEGGTIFLDEIGDISPTLQAKLLRVLEEKEYEPLGATTTVKADVRIVAATNRSLSELVKQHLFREDLFYRLDVVKVSLPPLASRREDVPLLVEHFIRILNERTGRRIEGRSDDIIRLLMNYDFPGNVRELENIIEHAFVMCHGPVIELEHLPERVLARASKSRDDGTGTADSPLHHAEAAAIIDALRKHDGNRRETAAYLGINKTTLWRKMKKYGITYLRPKGEDTPA
jgi:PAS domain S-box-containing protein